MGEVKDTPYGNRMVVPATGGPGGVVDRVVAGANVTVDATDPSAPVVSATGGGGGNTDRLLATVTMTAVASGGAANPDWTGVVPTDSSGTSIDINGATLEIVQAGVYAVTVQADFDGISATNCTLTVGDAVLGLSFADSHRSVTGGTIATVSFTYELPLSGGNNLIDITVFQNSGSAHDVIVTAAIQRLA